MTDPQPRLSPEDEAYLDQHSGVVFDPTITEDMVRAKLSALSLQEAADLLDTTIEQLRALAEQDRLSIVTDPNNPERGELVPVWQFNDNQLVPGLDILVSGFKAEDADDVNRFFAYGEIIDTAPQYGHHEYSPLEWLLAGLDPDAILENYPGLRYPEI